jgi:hypothetical protein
MPDIQQSMNRPDGIVRPAFGPIPLLLRGEVGFDDGFDHPQQCRLYHPIRDRR